MVAIVAVYFIVFRLRKDLLHYPELLNVLSDRLSGSSVFFWLLLFCIVFLNWSIEAYKWKYLLKPHARLTFIFALKSVLIGLSVGVFSPFRLAEIPARAILLSKEIRVKSVVLATVNSWSQLSLTIVFGLISLFFVPNLLQKYENILFFVFVLILIGIFVFIIYGNKLLGFLKEQKKKFKINLSIGVYIKIQLFSFFRYSLFLVQYLIVFKILGLNISSLNVVVGVVFVLFIVNILPIMQLFDISIRGGGAIFVFSMYNIESISIFTVFLIVWLISIVLPVIIGLYFLLTHKHYQKNNENHLFKS